MKRSSPCGFLFPSLMLMLTLCSPTALAQVTKGSWEKVQMVTPNSKLKIKTKTGQKVDGRMKTVTADSITLTSSRAGSNDIEVKQEEIVEIRRKSGALIAGYAALLGGAGFAGGYGIGYGIGEAKNSRFRPEYPTAIFGAAVGAAVGAIIGSRGEVIYKVK